MTVEEGIYTGLFPGKGAEGWDRLLIKEVRKSVFRRRLLSTDLFWPFLGNKHESEGAWSYA